MGIGRMTLLAFDCDGEAQGAAPADLDGVTQSIDAGRFAHQAMIGQMAVLFHPLQNFDCAVDGRALFVIGDEKRNRTVELRVLAHKIHCSCGKGSNRSLHVGSTPAIKKTIFDFCFKRQMGPDGFITLWHDISVASKTKMWARIANAGEEVVDVRSIGVSEDETLAIKTSAL